MNIRRIDPEGVQFDLSDERVGVPMSGQLARVDKTVRLTLRRGPEAVVEVELSKTGPAALAGTLRGFGSTVPITFDRAAVRAQLEAVRGSRGGLPANLQLPAGYLSLVRQVQATPALAAFGEGVGGRGRAPAEARVLGPIAALLAPESARPWSTGGRTDANLRGPISFGDSECDQIAELAYDECGGGIVCAIVATYYNALCTILSLF